MSVYLTISFTGYTQNIPPDEVPVSVKQSFAKKFPTAAHVKYEMEKIDYEVTFKDNGVEMSANFNAIGKWLETETAIKVSDLPKEVSSSVSRKFAGFMISEVTRVKTKDKQLFYKMELKTDKQGYQVQFSSNGHMLKTAPLNQ